MSLITGFDNTTCFFKVYYIVYNEVDRDQDSKHPVALSIN